MFNQKTVGLADMEAALAAPPSSLSKQDIRLNKDMTRFP
jgi:hypothetical protein